MERKNGWLMAEAIGEKDPQGVQRLLSSARWDADEVRDDLREYVFEHLADEETGILSVDETGFLLKKGEKSVGVARQCTGTAKKKIEEYVERLPEGAFSEVRPARDTGGRRPWEWACLDLAPKKGMRRWLLVRRSTDDPEERGFYQAYGPEGTTVEELVRVCQERWAVEECFAEAKGEVVGLDHYEVRKWDAWHRHHLTLCLLAHAFLAVVRSSVEQEEGPATRGISISA